jgi:flagellar motility protein MotE (MotC chaperone)
MTSYDDDDARPRRRFRLMPVTMTMLSLLLVAKLTETATGVNDLLSIRNAQASSAAKEEEAPAKEGDGAAAEEGGHESGEGEKPKEEKTLGAGNLTVKEVEALKDKPIGATYTAEEIDLLQNLTKRRDALDAQEKDLTLKSKILEATEQRINGKLEEMKVLQAELAKVIAQYNQHQNDEIKSLVKIYENMKPGDAAAIFNELDMTILLEVIDKMSERKVAPILAGMDTKRARDVTQELAELRRNRSRLGSVAAQAAAPAN